MIDILATGRARARMPRSLILEPTRELAAQVAEAFDVYGKYHKLSQALLIGGETFTDQVRKLDRGVDVLIATPGRLIDLFERGNLMLNDIKVFVIDEADRMLDMGFIPDIERIVAMLPKIRQTLFFSATMPPEIKRLADAFLINPKEVSVSPPASPAEMVTQSLIRVADRDKRKVLRHLLRTEDVKNALIFCNRKRDVALLLRSLDRHGFSVGALHGDMPQNKRTETLEAFRRGDMPLMVCSDVAARGLDIQGLSHVFNFDVPINAEDYIHRIGRTGRAGRSGRAFTLVGPEDARLLGAITRLIKKDIPTTELEGFDPGADADGDDAEERQPRARARRGEDRRPRRSSASGEEDRRPTRPIEAEARQSPRPVEDEERRPPRPVEDETRRPSRPIEDEERSDRRRRSEEDRPFRADSERAHHHERDRRRRDFDDDVSVIGFGDHVPAFMLRAGRSRPRDEAAEG